MDGELLDFGVSGKLRQANLIMYDRQTESWWQEFGGDAIVGVYTGVKLEQLPMAMVSWSDFKNSFPDGKVLSKPDSGLPYGLSGYVGYDTYNQLGITSGSNEVTLTRMARVAGIELNGESFAAPYSVLREQPVVEAIVGGEPVVVFYEPHTASALDNEVIALGREVGSVGVFSPIVDGDRLSFSRSPEGEDGVFVDEETGSKWDMLGLAISGPLEGARLDPLPHYPSVLWFSWASFRPDAFIYRP